MGDFPKFLLVLAFTSVAAAIWSIFYLFGFPEALNFTGVMRFLGRQLLWLVPVLLFFVSLNEYRRGFEKRAWFLASFGAALSVFSLINLFLK